MEYMDWDVILIFRIKATLAFNKFVQNGYYEKDWCNFDDKYKISNLDYE